MLSPTALKSEIEEMTFGSSCGEPERQITSFLFSLILRKASVVPGTASLTTMTFTFGSSAKPTICEMVVSISCMKLSGKVTCLIMPPLEASPYSLTILSAPR